MSQFIVNIKETNNRHLVPLKNSKTDPEKKYASNDEGLAKPEESGKFDTLIFQSYSITFKVIAGILRLFVMEFLHRPPQAIVRQFAWSIDIPSFLRVVKWIKNRKIRQRSCS